MLARRLLLPFALVLGLAACTRSTAETAVAPPESGVPVSVTSPITASATTVTTTTETAASSTSSTSSTTSSTSTTSTSTTSTSTTSTTTTTTVPPLDVFDPACVVEVQAGDSLLGIVTRFDDDTVDVETVQAENGLTSDVITPGQLLDVCVANGVDDITGDARTERNAVLVQRDVAAQQTRLNEVFAGLGIRELLVDGVSGPVTRQRLCAFRLANNLPVSTDDMLPGTAEYDLLMAATGLSIPFTSALASPRWILIDRTCQIVFVGEATDRLVFVFPTSTGAPGFDTRDQKLSRAFKFNPALHNGGWHDSFDYPAAEDNPLNGNMYKPLYFDRGQAIHGANNVPTSPQSKGCARLRVEHQDQLVAWLGLGDAGGIVSNRDRINVTVTVQGTYVPR